MKTKVLFLLVVTIFNATGAPIDTAQIDQLTGLKGKLNEKEGAYKSVSPAKMSRFWSMAGKYRLSWDSAPGPHLPKPHIVKPWSWVIPFY